VEATRNQRTKVTWNYEEKSAWGLLRAMRFRLFWKTDQKEYKNGLKRTPGERDQSLEDKTLGRITAEGKQKTGRIL